MPQIEVTFEVDVNGILQVTAADKAAKKSKSITITNEKGRLSEDEIQEKIREAEEFAEEDRSIRERVEAKNKLETYIFKMKSSLNDENIGSKIDSEERESIEMALKDGMQWLDENQNADKYEVDEKMNEVEDVCNPILSKFYSSSDDGDDHHEL